MRAPAFSVAREAAAGPIPQSATVPTRGSSRSFRKWLADTLRRRVDVHAVPAREAVERQVAIRRQLDGEGGRRADADEDGASGDRGLLDELEGQAAGHAEHIPG